MRPTCISAPGKLLLTGGYLVLDEQYAGIVLSSTARFSSHVDVKIRDDGNNVAVSLSEWRPLFPLTVESPQFKQLISGWIEKNNDGRFRFQLRENSHRNAYIEKTGDNDFYSQVKRLQDTKLPLRRESLKALQAFLPPTVVERGDELVALKTGMGSSAALVTSLVAALVAFFVPSMKIEEQRRDLELVHNLAQLSHCYVQRKIGSGFDVSAACFGSHVYTRFPASILDAFTSEDAMKSEDIALCITDYELWETSNRVKSVRLPSAFHLLMGDVSSGSATVSMVRKILRWKKDQPEHAERVMEAINRHSMEVEAGFAEIWELEASLCTPFDWKAMAASNRNKWSTMHAKIGTALLRTSEAYARFRELMRNMGAAAGVPIEPPQQTAILDATLAIPGVLLAGVPGAGGYDAICVVVIHESVLQTVEDLWVQWSSTHPNSVICPLLCDIDRGLESSSAARSGLQVHSVE
ncbi:unnamed protein product [Peronospora destructor]|uniref:phosphomevalonate kinase n=1 Tax=Peronospora destructor TaxID=86335 RepID=A0AAV0VDW4_9STRA|nr:unnamed protein product [Peronospora destructor]